MSGDNSSSLKAYVDSAAGAVQSAIGSLTGSTGDKVRDGLPQQSDPFPRRFQFNLTSPLLPSPPLPLDRSSSQLTPPPPQAHGETTKDKAAAEHDASHSVAKVGPFAASPSGGISQDDPNRTEGSWNQTVGSGKEMVGNLVGAEGLKNEGIQQNREGKGQEAQGQLSDLGTGMADRAKGALGSGVAGLTGDKADQERFGQMHDDGKTQLRSAQADIQKQSE
ncbi:hypothetical protein MMC19_007203 [Ptychographa xylographoides]|nr:hypothetical protein [Ptychographa xylographoides]